MRFLRGLPALIRLWLSPFPLPSRLKREHLPRVLWDDMRPSLEEAAAIRAFEARRALEHAQPTPWIMAEGQEADFDSALPWLELISR